MSPNKKRSSIADTDETIESAPHTSRVQAWGFAASRAWALGRLRSLLLVGVVSFCAAFMIGLVGWAGGIATLVDESWPGSEMIVYLDDGVDDAKAESIRSRLKASSLVRHVTYFSSEEALERAEEILFADGLSLDSYGDDVFPSSLEVEFVNGINGIMRTEAFVSTIKQTDGVFEIEFLEKEHRVKQDQAQIAVSRIKSARIICWGLAFFLLVLGLWSDRRRYRQELHAWTMCGATNYLLKIPTIVRGGLAGFAGAAVASMALWLLIPLFSSAFGAMTWWDGGVVQFDTLGFKFASLCFVGTAMGALGGLIASILPNR